MTQLAEDAQMSTVIQSLFAQAFEALAVGDFFGLVICCELFFLFQRVLLYVRQYSSSIVLLPLRLPGNHRALEGRNPGQPSCLLFWRLFLLASAPLFSQRFGEGGLPSFFVFFLRVVALFLSFLLFFRVVALFLFWEGVSI